jgi:tetratricopeptide (TPR) repeat protein
MLHTQTMKTEVTYRIASVRQILSLAIAAALIVIAGGFLNQVAAQKLKSDKMSKFAPQGTTDAANAKFQGGRDLISDEEYAKAVEKFSEYIALYSKEKNIDAAMYWTAYSQFKLKEFDQAKETIERLLKTYEKTTWKGDAQMLLAQLPNGMTVNVDPITVTVGSVEVEARMQEAQEKIRDAQERLKEAQERATERALAGQEREQERVEAALERLKDFNFNFNGIGVGGPNGSSQSDDDPCEFKIVVLQALFESDPQRGVAAATDWLKPGSTQTPRCKGAALTLLARHGGKAATPTILGVARTETDPKLRAKAISVLGATNDDSVVDALRDFALNSQDSDTVEAALFALSQHQSARAVTALGEIAMSNKSVAVRRMAIAGITNRQGEPAVDELFKIYDADQNLEIRKAVVSGFSHRRSDRVGTKLLEIARGSDNVELRKSAISGIARRGGDHAIDTLLSLYDTEKSDELKDQIINSLGYGALAVGPNGLSYPNDQRVTRKLIEIARNPQTPIERRRRAIGLLSRSKDPEVLKFLEDLLKQ